MIVAFDLGCREIKSNIDGEYVDQQLVASEVNQVANDPINYTNEELVHSTIETMLDNLDVTVHEKKASCWQFSKKLIINKTWL